MGLRFRRTVKILPGVALNFGKTGMSVSLGPRGAKYTLSSRGHRGTIGLPGTGLSFTKFRRHNNGGGSGVNEDGSSQSTSHIQRAFSVFLKVVFVAFLCYFFITSVLSLIN